MVQAAEERQAYEEKCTRALSALIPPLVINVLEAQRSIL